MRLQSLEALLIPRIWCGWTTIVAADDYESLLLGTIVPGIVARAVAGFRDIQVLRHPPEAGEVEFTTIMWFDSLEAVREFAGEDYEVAVVPPAARALLTRFDERSRHAEVRFPERDSPGGAPRGSEGPEIVVGWSTPGDRS